MEKRFFSLFLKIKGRVQGVNFRWHTLQKAESLGLVGWVKNETDSQVLVSAQGGKKELEKLLKWCKQGPNYALVEDVEIELKEIKNLDYPDFQIKY